MNGTEGIFFLVIVVASVVIGAAWSGWASSQARTGRDLGPILTVNWVIAAGFAVMGITGGVMFFSAAAFSKIGWTMMICGAVVALVLAGHHVTLRKLGRAAEERRMFASDL
jgi:hypothetical protein